MQHQQNNYSAYTQDSFIRFAEQQKSILDALNKIDGHLKDIILREDEDRTRPISSSMPVIIDYLNRRAVLLFTSVALTMSIEDAGTVSIPANSWTDISFPAGTRLYATNLTNQVQVLLRATDRAFFANAASTSGGGGSFNLTQVGGNNITLGQQVMGLSIPVVIASNQSAISVTGTVNSQNTATAVSDGLSSFHLISAATTNATLLKASPGQIYNIIASNTTTADAYLKLFNKSSAPIPGTDTPFKTIDLGGAATAAQNLPVIIGLDYPIPFSIGLGIALVTGIADANATAVAAAQCSIDIDFA